ncbi:hypothetical protein TrRE_jg12259 [Triparma retinervis]|uniref:Sulfate transporter n=1 Tax=Triparma retinervis TaxID=2557542 RepID=A0A9W7FCB0_9STRA|nr:hypothetical protein TrRE_jg12259 [Triparma retinervis]
MKAISAVAIAEGLSRQEVTASGVIVGWIIFVIGVTGLIEAVNKVVPREVVSGLQLGLGVKLAALGVKWITDLPWASQLDSITLGIVAFALAMFLLKAENDKHAEGPNTATTSNIPERFASYKRCLPPTALTLFLIGLTCSAITLSTSTPGTYSLPLKFFGPPVAFWALGDITPSQWSSGFTSLAIPQVPLTTLNAVISLKQAAVSIGLMNGIFCMFGSMPNCHGAGGLAGQHKFGARNGASIVFLGLCKMLLGALAGSSALTMFEAMPRAVLGVMLGVSGAELAATGVEACGGGGAERGGGKRAAPKVRVRYFVMMVTAVVIVGSGKTQYGVLAGLAAYVLYGDGVEEYGKICRKRGKEEEEEEMVRAEVEEA